MRSLKYLVIVAIVGLFLAACAHNSGPAGKAPRMSKDELRSLLGSPNLVILDVRLDREWEKSKTKIQGAVREDPEKDTRTWMNRYPKDKILVFYCS